MDDKIVAQLQDEQKTILDNIQKTVELGITENRDNRPDEVANMDAWKARLDSIENRLAQIADVTERRNRADAVHVETRTQTAKSEVRVNSEPLTYAKENRSASFFADLVHAKHNFDADAMARLQRHQSEMRVENRAAMATSDLSNGFVPPLYLSSDYAELRRYGRPVANAVGSRNLSALTMYVPRLTQGAAVAIQSSENSSLTNQGFTSSDIQADAKLVGGYVDASIQSIDFGHLSDADIFADLQKNYNMLVEDVVLNSTTSNRKGILQTTGVNLVSGATNTFSSMNSKIVSAKKNIWVNYKGSASHIVVSANVYAWLLTLLDNDNRPVFAPINQVNGLGSFEQNMNEGAVGIAWGLPVIVSQAMPTTDSATPNTEDIIVANLNECRLFETAVKTATFEDVGSGTATVRFRLHGYVAFTAARQPASISKITGLTSSLGV